MAKQSWLVKVIVVMVVVLINSETFVHAAVLAGRAADRRRVAMTPTDQLDRNIRASRNRIAARNDVDGAVAGNRRRAVGRGDAAEGGRDPQAAGPAIPVQVAPNPVVLGAPPALLRYSIPGDFNNDYIVGVKDLIAFRNNLDQFNGNAKLSDGDFDGDGYVSRADLPYFTNLYGTDERASLTGVHVVETTEGWQLLVDGNPYVVRGVTYQPDIVGKDPNNNSRPDWMYVDLNQNGLNDFAYDSWVDLDKDNFQDANEPAIGDFQLLANMGVNTIRLYHHASDDPELMSINTDTSNANNHAPNKALLRDLYERYGIRVAMGDLLGAYTVGSGADYPTPTDYTDPVQRAHMLRSVEVMVNDFKDEEFVLMWVLGNENNLARYSITNASSQPVAYAQFVNEVAALIHRLDPTRPVALSNGDFLHDPRAYILPQLAQYAPELDIVGFNTYRGENGGGFGGLWQTSSTVFDRPVMMTEYGDLRGSVSNDVLDEEAQADAYISSWMDISAHTAGSGANYPVSIGGFVHTWLDDWWQGGARDTHNTGPDDLSLEYQGIAGQGDGTSSPFIRQLRDSYYAYQALWT